MRLASLSLNGSPLEPKALDLIQRLYPRPTAEATESQLYVY